MQLPEKYKENFNVFSEGPSYAVTKSLRLKCRNSPSIFQVVASLVFPTNESLSVTLLTLPTLVQDYLTEVYKIYGSELHIK